MRAEDASGDAPGSGIYRGHILHKRFLPKPHLFTYPVFVFCLDLDEVERKARGLRLFAHNRFSLYALRDSDHLGDPARPIKENVVALLRARGYHGPVDRVFMVTQLRVLGYLFNPVTFFYCYAGGEEVAYVAEVNNTFRQRHCYVFFGGGNSFRTDKVFYVSPFLEMDLVYHFRFTPLASRLGVFIDDYRPRAGGGEDKMLQTHIVGKRLPFSDARLLASFLAIPWMSAWIIGWIHWQALKLWLKKVPLVFRPADGMKPGWENPKP
jgi:DUF1365 family protein